MRAPRKTTPSSVFRGFRAAWLGVFGMPNYEAYLDHMRANHPREMPKGRGEFVAWALERRHAGRGPRCC
jgi:uncharacterized short protein YbdD (DUF466 family)